jgi:hypothetical protein
MVSSAPGKRFFTASVIAAFSAATRSRGKDGRGRTKSADALINVHKNEFSFLNFILVVTAKRGSISQSAIPALGFQSNGRRSRPKECPHVT